MPPKHSAAQLKAQTKLAAVAHRASKVYAKLPESSKMSWKSVLSKEWKEEKKKHPGRGK